MLESKKIEVSGIQSFLNEDDHVGSEKPGSVKRDSQITHKTEGLSFWDQSSFVNSENLKSEEE